MNMRLMQSTSSRHSFVDQSVVPCLTHLLFFIISMRLKEPALVALRGSVAHESKLQAYGNRLSQGRWDK